MPAKHREFIVAIEKAGSVRDFVKENKDSAPELRDNYNRSIKLLERFRSTHLQFAKTYISDQTQVSNTNPSQVGTGGTPHIQYLGKT